jgi:hypothetical protein
MGEHGRALFGLIVEQGNPVDDHEFRVIHGDGHWWALFSVAQAGIPKLAMLAFHRNGTVGPETKAEMWRLLAIGERLCRQLLAEELAS